MVYLYAADTSGLPDPYENPDIMEECEEIILPEILCFS